MKRLLLTVAAAAILAIAAFAPVAAQDSLTLALDEVDESGISGTVRIAAENGESTVSILITAGLEDGAVHPVHIHDGTCDDLGGVAYPLDDIVDGSSETTIEVSLSELLEGEYAINAHLSADEMAVNIACANIDEDEATEEDDEAVEEDDEAADDEADDEEVVDEEADDAVEEDDEADDYVEDVVPAAGSVGGLSTDTAAMMLVLGASAMLGTGVLVRRRGLRFQRS
jgi:hypothetical protein